MKQSEKQDLKRKLGRIGIFLLMVFLPVLIICILLAWAKVPQWLNIMVLVIVMFLLYFLFAFVCSKLDQRKQKRISKKKDPFSD